MSLALDPRYYAHVPVLLWPVLFLRLLALQGWCRRHDRAVMFTVTSAGRVVVRHMDDDPDSFAAWRARNRAARPHLACLVDADGAACVNPIVILMGRAVERCGALCRWVWVRVVGRAAPQICDSS